MSKYVSLFGGLLLLCIVPFFLKDAQGKPVMTLDFIQGQLAKALQPFEEASEAAEQATGLTVGSKPNVYKWQDANGQWHFGDKPSAGAVKVDIDTNANIVQLPTGTVAEDKTADNSGPQVSVFGSADSDQQRDKKDLSLSLNPIERIQDAVNLGREAERLGEQIEARNKSLDVMLEQNR